MKRKFKLAPVVRIRQLQEREAAGVHAMALSDVRAAEDRVVELATALGSMTTPTGVPAEVLQAASVFRDVTAASLGAARDRVEELAEVAEVTRVEWTGAAQRSKVMEKLQDRHRDAVNAAEQHAETIQVDDLVSARYAGRKN